MNIISNNYLPGDQRLIEQIVRELKSQGIFDQFRKECISDVDTKPAYQNLRQRVESSVSGFLTKQTWNPEMNKNQVREMLRKNIHESGFLETGVERIVDQVVNPKITTVFLTKVEDVVYKFLGIEKPIKVDSSDATTLKVNSFHDLLPTDLEAVSPEMPEDKDMEMKEIEDVKMEEESPTYELLNERKEKFSQEENSIDSSQSSVVSAINSNDSNHSQKQESLMSLNSSESRLSLVISENTGKMEDDVFVSHKFSKLECQINDKMDNETVNQDPKIELENANDSCEKIENQSNVAVQKTSEDNNSKLKDSVNKKRERQHSSSEKSKSKNDKDRIRSDKHKKDGKDNSKEQPIEKEKYRIPRLSDKNKTDKLDKSKEKDKHDKERDKKSDKDKRSAKHSSERDRSKSDSRSRKDSKSDRKDKEKDDKKEKKDSSKSEKSKDERKSSSHSSKQKEKSSHKDKNKEKDKETKKMNDESKNGQSSSTSSSTKRESSKHKKDEDKSKSSKRKDEKNDKDDKKKRKSSKDDHYSSKEKKNGRRSSDRDSDGPPENKILPINSQKNSDKYSQAPTQDSFHSNSENSTDDSGNKDRLEDINEESNDTLQLEMQKFKLPKYASNLQEAMKIMKIKKQIKRFENTNKLNSENTEVKQLLKDIAEISKDGKKDKLEEPECNQQTLEMGKIEVNDSMENLSLNINDFISSSNISIDKWNALEAKYMGEMGCTDYDSYESPYGDNDLELISSEKNINSETTDKVLQNLESNELENIRENKHEASHNHQLEKFNLYEEDDEMNNECKETTDNTRFEEKGLDNESFLSIEDKDELSLLKQIVAKARNSKEVISLAAESKQPDPSFRSELGEIKPQIECQTNELLIKDKETNSKKKLTKFEECQRRAIVRLEKSSLAEEMIQNRRISKHVNQDNSDNLNNDNALKSLETEKENIQVNKIQTYSNLESTVRPMKSFEKNLDTNQDATNTIKNFLEDRLCNNSDEIVPRICEQDNTDNCNEANSLSKSVNEKILNTSYQNLLSETSLTNMGINEDHEEEPCLGFESSDIERNLTILKCLIKSFEDSISESVENIKKIRFSKQQNISLHPEKIEIKDQNDISNNNLQNLGYKRRRTISNSNSLVQKKFRSNDSDNEEISDIALESKFSLPLSPAESEYEKRVDTRLINKKSEGMNKNVDVPIGELKECNDSSTASKFKSPPKKSSGKKSTGQRYSSEDLYKPRMFLRRSRSGTNDS